MVEQSDVSVTVVTSDAGFAELGERWNTLADVSETGTVFLRHEWFDAAWGWLADTHERFVLLVERGGEALGIWPLMKSRRKYRRLDVNAIEFMGVPDTQVCDVLCAPADHETVVDALLDYLSGHSHDWDVCEFEKLPADSRTATLLERGRGGRAAFDVSADGSNPQVSLGGTWQDYYATRSRRLKKGNNLVANRLKKQYDDINIRWVRADDADERGVSQALQSAIDLSSLSWKRETGNSLDNSGPNAFIRKLTSHALAQGWLSLWILELDGKPAAMEYQLAFRGDIHALRGDFDDGLANLSPGTFLNWRILERLFDENERCYHMGPGDNSYKLRWAEQSPELCRAVAYSRSLRGRAMSIAERSLRPLAVTAVDWARNRFVRKD